MKFEIENNPVFSTLKIQFEHGESFKAEAGSMLAMNSNIHLEAKAAGKGVLGTLKAAIGGESFFASLFIAESGPGEVILAPSNSGQIIEMDMAGNTLFCEGGAYLAGSTSLEISTKGSLKGFISGEGLFLQKISGHGKLFLSSYGAIITKELQPGEKYMVDTGHLVAFEEGLNYSIRKVSRSLFSTIASGEGLVAEFTGPGRIWLQTRNLSAFVGLIERFLPGR